MQTKQIRDIIEDDLEKWEEIAEKTRERMNNPEFGFDEEGNPKPLPKVNRGSWFCPCITIEEAKELHKRCKDRGINKIYDLGAGDFRLSILFNRLGYEVVAFETLEDLILDFIAEHPESDIDVRMEDYYEAFPEIVDENSCYACFGGTNKLPMIPEKGLAVQGFNETGIEVWFNGKPQENLMEKA